MKDTVLVLGDFFDVLPDAMVVVDGSGKIVFANTAVYGLLGYKSSELVDQSLSCLIPKAYRAGHELQFAKFRDHGKPTAMGARPLLDALHKSDIEVPISISIANMELEGELFSVAVMRDSGRLYSEIVQATDQAETDALTGIGNRLRLSRNMQEALAASRSFGLLFLDLVGFKPFNDDYGHEVGDEVLIIIARRLQALIRSDDIAVRLGGDEFVLVLDGLVDVKHLEERAETVAESLTQPFQIGDLSSMIKVNIGGAIFPDNGATEAELLKVADQNMYQAKQAGLAYKV